MHEVDPTKSVLCTSEHAGIKILRFTYISQKISSYYSLRGVSGALHLGAEPIPLRCSFKGQVTTVWHEYQSHNRLCQSHPRISASPLPYRHIEQLMSSVQSSKGTGLSALISSDRLNKFEKDFSAQGRVLYSTCRSRDNQACRHTPPGNQTQHVGSHASETLEPENQLLACLH